MTTEAIYAPLANTQQRIAEFKGEIDHMLATQSAPTANIGDALVYLERAEKLAGSILASRRARAWHELAQAKLALKQTQKNSASVPRDSGEMTNRKSDTLRDEWQSVKDDLHRIQSRCPHVNVAGALNWLMWAERALEKDKPDNSRAMYCIMQARCSLVYAEECVKWITLGGIVILIELAYLALLPVLMVLYAYFLGFTIESVVSDAIELMMTKSLLHIPDYVFVWGFLGGAVWCLNDAALWSKQRLFDKHHLVWYIAHPWVSAVLGGAVALIILGGLSNITAAASPAATTPATAALLSLVSFVAGFSTDSIWKLLDRAMRKLLNDEQTIAKKHREVSGNVVEHITKQ
jgi:hypothetical protein